MSGSKLVAKRGHTLAQTLWAQWLTDATARLAETRTVYSGLSSPASNNLSPNQDPAERRLTSARVASEQVAEREAVMVACEMCDEEGCSAPGHECYCHEAAPKGPVVELVEALKVAPIRLLSEAAEDFVARYAEWYRHARRAALAKVSQ